MRLGGGPAVARLKQEELSLRTGVQRVAALSSHGNDTLQRRTRATGEGLAIRGRDVADDPRNLLAGRTGPREDAEGVQVRTQVHVRFLDPDESLDRRPVEHDPAIERFGELPVRNLDVLDRAEDIGELQAQEFDLLALRSLEDRRAAVGVAAALNGLGHRL